MYEEKFNHEDGTPDVLPHALYWIRFKPLTRHLSLTRPVCIHRKLLDLCVSCFPRAGVHLE